MTDIVERLRGYECLTMREAAAEIERLQQDVNVVHADICAENDNLKAEVQALHQDYGAVNAQLKAEIERLQGVIANPVASLLDRLAELAIRVKQLEQENERLRGHIYASNRPQPEDIERLRAEIDQLKAVLEKERQPEGTREEQVAEWLRERGYEVLAYDIANRSK